MRTLTEIIQINMENAHIILRHLIVILLSVSLFIYTL